MIRVDRWTTAALTGTFLLLALPIHGGRALQAAPADDKSGNPTNDSIPVPSCDRIDYSRPDACVALGPHFGNKDHIMKVAAEVKGKTPEEKLLSIYRWIHSNLVYKADAPYEWRDFDRLVADGNYGGCADYSVVFGTLARACGIPTVWVKTLDVDWIREYRKHGTEGTWSGHVFLEIFIHNRWVLLDDTELVLYENYDPKMRILPGNRYAYDKGGDPFDLVLSSRWELWKKETRAYFRDFDLSKLPVGRGRPLAGGTNVATPGVTAGPTKYPAVFVFYPKRAKQSAGVLFGILYPKLTHHLTGRYHSVRDYQEQFTKWAKPGDTVVLLLLADDKDCVPKDFQDLMPKSWSELEAAATAKGAVRYDGESRQMHTVVLVAKSPDELTSLIRKIQW
jgi:hypothetical protein